MLVVKHLHNSSGGVSCVVPHHKLTKASPSAHLSPLSRCPVGRARAARVRGPLLVPSCVPPLAQPAGSGRRHSQRLHLSTSVPHGPATPVRARAALTAAYRLPHRAAASRWRPGGGVSTESAAERRVTNGRSSRNIV